MSKISVTLSFTWGTSLSIAAAIRNRDDTVNHLYSSAAVGATLGAISSCKINLFMIYIFYRQIDFFRIKADSYLPIFMLLFFKCFNSIF